MKLAHIKFTNFVNLLNWYNQLPIHFAGLAQTKKKKQQQQQKNN